MATTSLAGDRRDAIRNEAIGRLAGGVAHDVNNLLMVILRYVDLVLDRIQDGSPARRDALEIKTAAESAARVTSELVALSQQQQLLPRPLDVGGVVQELGGALGRAVGSNVDLVFELADSLPDVEADRGQIERIVMNLVVNARDAVGAGGRVTVTTEADPDGSRVRLHVADNGPGIPDDVRARIFEPFFTTKKAGKGTGLGLAIVQVLAIQTGATIDIHSRAGQGTTFTIAWPALTKDLY